MVALDFSLVLVLFSAAAVSLVSKRFSVPSVPGFLALGFVLGPVWTSLGPIGGISSPAISGGLVGLMSELGLLFLLFLVGLEVKIEEIRDYLETALVMSVFQSLAVLTGVFGLLQLLGFGLLESLIISVALTPSSAAVVVPTLSQRDEISSRNGSLDISVLVVESLLMVLVIGLVSSYGGALLPSTLRIGGSVVAAAFLAWAASRYLVPEVMERVAGDESSFLVSGLGFLSVFVLFSEFAGLQPEIGAFFAGVSIAQLPYSSELHAEVEPLTELFLAIFLVGLGLEVEVASLLNLWDEAVLISVLVVPLKAGSYFFSSFLRGSEGFLSLRSSLDLSQVSDLALVVGGVAVSAGALRTELLALLSLVALITMSSSTMLMFYGDRIASRFFTKKSSDSSGTKAILVGYGSLGSSVLDLLQEFFGEVVVVDRSVETIGVPDTRMVFGDFGHEDVRREAGLDSAESIVSLDEDLDLEEEVLEEASGIPVVLSSDSPELALEMLNSGADFVLSETLLSDGEMLRRVTKSE